MRLTSIEIRDYRSLFLPEGGAPFALELAPGMNTLVGLNNCGKSNVLRAVSLALDPNHPFDPELDAPGPRPFSLPIIELRFDAEGERHEEQELLRAALDYEIGIGTPADDAHASEGRVVLQVAFQQGPDGHRRRERLLTPDHRVPSTAADHERLSVALSRLRDAVRFVLISSGESIASVLEGNFREILHSVVRERLNDEFTQAEQSRQEYIRGLQESLLAPLRARLSGDVGGLFPEIGGTYLSPEVPTIERTLSNVGVSLEDLVVTPLDQKGTGVRGGVLVAMLSYLALNATRGMVFAVEEPEAFLHPASQEDLRDRLEELAASKDVTLLVTTHSPYLVSRSSTGRIFSLAKDADGRTRVAETASGDASHTRLVGDLFRETTLAEILTHATDLPTGAEAVLIVEGDGDEFCLRLAAELIGRPELLSDIHIQPAGSASKVVAQAVIARAASPKPVFVLVDNDDPGKEALKLLTGKAFGFQKERQAASYAIMFPESERNFPYEAEDLFAPEVIEAFLEKHGDAAFDGSKRRPDGAFHYDIPFAAKKLLTDHVRSFTRAEHVTRWVELILWLRGRLGLPCPDSTAEELVDAAPPAPPQSGFGGSAVVISDKLAHAAYQSSSALVLDVDEPLPADLSHVAFYVDGAIQPAVPVVQGDYPGLLLSASTADQLRATAQDVDARAAALIEELLRSDDPLTGTTHRVLILSTSDDDETLHLDQPVRNTKERKGRPLAWAVGTKVVRASSLAQNPATTDELDQLERESAGVSDSPSEGKDQ